MFASTSWPVVLFRWSKRVAKCWSAPWTNLRLTIRRCSFVPLLERSVQAAAPNAHGHARGVVAAATLNGGALPVQAMPCADSTMHDDASTTAVRPRPTDRSLCFSVCAVSSFFFSSSSCPLPPPSRPPRLWLALPMPTCCRWPDGRPSLSVSGRGRSGEEQRTGRMDRRRRSAHCGIMLLAPLPPLPYPTGVLCACDCLRCASPPTADARRMCVCARCALVQASCTAASTLALCRSALTPRRPVRQQFSTAARNESNRVTRRDEQTGAKELRAHVSLLLRALR